MELPNDYKKPIADKAMSRLVEDGNTIQNLIAKLDFQTSFGQLAEALETIDILGSLLSSMDDTAGMLHIVLYQNIDHD